MDNKSLGGADAIGANLTGRFLERVMDGSPNNHLRPMGKAADWADKTVWASLPIPAVTLSGAIRQMWTSSSTLPPVLH